MKKYRTRIFDFTTVKKVPTQGSLLVAEPFLREVYFCHSVVSLIDCDKKDNPIGVVLNNSTDIMLPKVLSEVNDSVKVPLYRGGPMGPDRLFFIHTLGEEIIPGARNYAPGLWVGGDFNAAIDYVNNGYPVDGFLRFFIGYSGWTYSQLLDEVQNNVWAVASPDILSPMTLLDSVGDHLWHSAVRAMGPEYSMWKLHPLSRRSN